MKVFVAVLAGLLSCSTGAFGTTTLTVSTASPCAKGTTAIASGTGVSVVMTCDATETVTNILAGGTLSVVYKEGTDIVFELPEGTTALTGTPVVFKTGQTAVTVGSATITAADVGDNLAITITNFPADANTAAWTCEVVDSAAGNAGSEGGQTTGVDLSNFCSATTSISVDSCSATKTMTCDLGVDVAAAQTNGGVIQFYKGTTLTFQIAAADDALTDGTNAVTGFTVAAPVATSGDDAQLARLTYTTATYDSTTVDGDWYCVVTGATTTTNNVVSAITALSSTCSSAINNQVTGLFVALLIAVKTLLF